MPQDSSTFGAFSLDLAPQGHMEVHCLVNGPVQTNTYFVVSNGEAIVIDPAWQGDLLAETFAAQQPDVKIKAILCTHGHADHLGGVAGLRRVLGDDLPFYLAAEDVDLIAQSIQGQKDLWNINTEDPGAVTGTLAEGQVFEFGDVKLQIFATPGHTQGCLVFFAATNDGNFAFVGDTLFPGGHGRVDFEESNPAVMGESLAKIGYLLPADTLCLAGHNDPTTMEKELAGNLFLTHAMKHHPRA